ncbi:MAG: hypothetical protein P9M13_01275 [Candidatus Ancaeobacter aquaticus]|nr:hypothetical protein [Candidatus Ancaeobacter aquaticus]
MKLNNIQVVIGFIFLGLILLVTYASLTTSSPKYMAGMVGLISATVLALYLFSDYKVNPFSKNRAFKVFIGLCVSVIIILVCLFIKNTNLNEIIENPIIVENIIYYLPGIIAVVILCELGSLLYYILDYFDSRKK